MLVFNKEMFEGEIPEYHAYAARSKHPEIAPANVRLTAHKRKIFRNIDEKVAEVKQLDSQLARTRQSLQKLNPEDTEKDNRRGLLTAQLGSIYEQRDTKSSSAFAMLTAQKAKAEASVYA